MTIVKLRVFRRALAALVLFAGVQHGVCQDSIGSLPQPALHVITTRTAPFVIPGEGGVLGGYSIELWNRTAREAGLKFDVTTVDSVTKVLKALQDGSADVGVGGLSITASRDKIVDFSVPFMRTGAQILVKSMDENSQFLHSCIRFIRLEILKVLGILLVVLFIFGNIVWLAQRKRNPDCFPPSYGRGVVEGMWWSLSIIVTSDQGGAEVVGWSGRILRLIWTLVGVAVFTYVTATITTSMTVSTLNSEITTINDLRSRSAASVSGSASEEYLKDNGISVRGYATIDLAIDALIRGDVDAVFYDAPVLEYHLTLRAHPGLRLLPELYGTQNYGFALQKRGQYRERINQALLTLSETGFLADLDKKWFAKEETAGEAEASK